MEYILLLLLLLNTSLAYSTFFDKKIEQTLFLSIFSYILILFIFGIFGSLNLGFIVIILLNLILLYYNIKSIVKKKVKFKENILTLGLVFIIASYVVIVWYSIGRFATIWDEFSHWALVVKNMYGLGNLGLGADSTVMVKSYLSGTSLFQFFCVKLCGEYKESMLYIGMDLILLSYIVPVFGTLKNKNLLLKSILFIILFFIPTLFNPTLYSSLYVDGILGLSFAYVLYSYFNNRKKDINRFDVINLMSSLSMLIFIKDFGLVLLLIAFTIILIDNMFIKNKFSFKELWRKNYLIIISIVPAFIIKFIWGIVLSINGVVGNSSNPNIVNTIFQFLKLELLDYQKQVVNSFVDASVSYSLTNDTLITITYLTCAIITFIISYFIYQNCKKENKKSAITSSILVILGYLGYGALILLAYLSIFSEYEALRLASFNRYMGSYALGAVFAGLAILIHVISKNEKKFDLLVIILLSIFTINFNFSTVLSMLKGPVTNNTKEVRIPYMKFAKKTIKHMKKEEQLYFISTNDNGIDYYIAKYELTPCKMDKNSAWSIGFPYSEEDIWTRYKTADDWREELLKDYDYVYLFDIDKEFINMYGKLFSNDDIKDNQLYKVNRTKEYSILEFVE